MGFDAGRRPPMVTPEPCARTDVRRTQASAGLPALVPLPGKNVARPPPGAAPQRRDVLSRLSLRRLQLRSAPQRTRDDSSARCPIEHASEQHSPGSLVLLEPPVRVTVHWGDADCHAMHAFERPHMLRRASLGRNAFRSDATLLAALSTTSTFRRHSLEEGSNPPLFLRHLVDCSTFLPASEQGTAILI